MNSLSGGRVIRSAFAGWALLAAWFHFAPNAAVPLSSEGRLALRGGDSCPARAKSKCSVQAPGDGCNNVVSCSLYGDACEFANGGEKCGFAETPIKSYKPPQCVAADEGHECATTIVENVKCVDVVDCTCVVGRDEYDKIISRGCGYEEDAVHTENTGFCVSN